MSIEETLEEPENTPEDSPEAPEQRGPKKVLNFPPEAPKSQQADLDPPHRAKEGGLSEEDFDLPGRTMRPMKVGLFN